MITSNIYAKHDPKSVDHAFQLSTTLNEDQVVTVHFNMAQHHYLYKKKIKFKIKKPKSAIFGRILMPEARIKEDPFFGQQAVYEDYVAISLPILNWQEGPLILEVDYQGCSKQGYCYPPKQQIIHVQQNGKTESIQIPTQKPNAALAWLTQKPLWLIPFGFIGLGLLLSLTPCTFPMIPILSSIILGYRSNLTTRKAFLLSFIYVVSMASVYALIGIMAGFLGSNFQMAFQSTWVILLFSSLFILLAFCSLAGVYHLKLPVIFEKYLLKLSHRQKGGTYLGVAIMGALSTLIVSPCVTPPLIGVISYMSQTGHAGLGGVALFFMGLGMGVPLLLIGTLEGRWLPKTGNWTRQIEIILGLLLLVVAINLLSKILPSPLILFLWGAVLLISAFYLGHFFSHKKIRTKTLRRSLAVVLIIYGCALMIGGLMGNDDFITPLKKTTQNIDSAVKNEFKVVTSLKEVEALLKKAKKHHQKTIIDVYADWCSSCKEIDKKLFQNPEVLFKIKDFQKIKIDVTKVNTESQALLKHFNIIGPPAILFFNSLGQLNARLVGDIQKESFLKQVAEKGEL